MNVVHVVIGKLKPALGHPKGDPFALRELTGHRRCAFLQFCRGQVRLRQRQYEQQQAECRALLDNRAVHIKAGTVLGAAGLAAQLASSAHSWEAIGVDLCGVAGGTCPVTLTLG